MPTQTVTGKCTGRIKALLAISGIARGADHMHGTCLRPRSPSPPPTRPLRTRPSFLETNYLQLVPGKVVYGLRRHLSVDSKYPRPSPPPLSLALSLVNLGRRRLALAHHANHLRNAARRKKRQQRLLRRVGRDIHRLLPIHAITAGSRSHTVARTVAAAQLQQPPSRGTRSTFSSHTSSKSSSHTAVARTVATQYRHKVAVQ